MGRTLLILGAIAALSAAGCGDEGGTGDDGSAATVGPQQGDACQPNALVLCTCPGGSESSLTCSPTGVAGACFCPQAAGGSVERARHHLEKARQLSKGRRVAPLVGFAESASVSTRNRKEFEGLLGEALALDVDEAPEHRLPNLIAQQRARWLLSRVDELFLE